jgi:hypothetical protein
LIGNSYSLLCSNKIGEIGLLIVSRLLGLC